MTTSSTELHSTPHAVHRQSSSFTPSHQEPSVLERRLGPYDAAAVVVSNVIGSGILFVPAVVALMVPHPMGILAVWVVGGMLALAGAMAYAELAALKPRAGGEYVYLREAFGPLAAFLTGWTSFVAGFSGAIAVAAVGLAAYLGRFIPVAGDATPLFSLPLGIVTLTVSPQALVALTAIVALTVVHILGIGPGRVVQNLLALAKVLALVAFVACGLTFGAGSVEHFAADTTPAPSGMLLALIPVMFAYSGWNAASYIAEEIRDPERNVPKALAIGTLAVVVLYALMNVGYLYALPVSALAELTMQSGRVIDVAADALFGPRVGDILTIVSLFIMTGTISAMVFAGPRVYFAMARDGLFLPAAARVHPTRRTPAFSIAAQGVWSGLLVLSGTFQQLLTYTGFAIMLFAGIAVSGLFVLRRRTPSAQRAFSAWGYPVAPALFVLASAAAVVNAMWRAPWESLAGVGIISLGIPLYFVMRRLISEGRG